MRARAGTSRRASSGRRQRPCRGTQRRADAAAPRARQTDARGAWGRAIARRGSAAGVPAASETAPHLALLAGHCSYADDCEVATESPIPACGRSAGAHRLPAQFRACADARARAACAQCT